MERAVPGEHVEVCSGGRGDPFDLLLHVLLGSIPTSRHITGNPWHGSAEVVVIEEE